MTAYLIHGYAFDSDDSDDDVAIFTDKEKAEEFADDLNVRERRKGGRGYDYQVLTYPLDPEPLTIPIDQSIWHISILIGVGFEPYRKMIQYYNDPWRMVSPQPSSVFFASRTEYPEATLWRAKPDQEFAVLDLWRIVAKDDKEAKEQAIKFLDERRDDLVAAWKESATAPAGRVRLER